VKITKTKTAETPAMSAIANGTKIVGNLNASSPIRIDGELDGDITSDSKIVLGPDAFVSGSIDGQEVIIAGEVQGTVNAKIHLTLQPKAKVNGDIQAKEFVIESGAQFNGACQMYQETPTISLEAKQA